jgi:hypothetical protein
MEKIINAPTAEQVKLFYEATLHFTKLTDYGILMQDILSGKEHIPPMGVRFDVEYEGSVQGSRINGIVKGIDYVEMRADGRLKLHLHGHITTVDGARIAYHADAIGTNREGTALLQMRENVVLYSAHANYNWVNKLAVWSETVIDLMKGEILVKAYVL